MGRKPFSAGDNRDSIDTGPHKDHCKLGYLDGGQVDPNAHMLIDRVLGKSKLLYFLRCKSHLVLHPYRRSNGMV